MYSFLVSLVISFIPFVLLGALSIEILMRHPDSSLHRLTTILIGALSFIFLSDFLTQSLDYGFASWINPRMTYDLTFIAITILTYFFAILSRIQLPFWLLHPFAGVPLVGIILLHGWPDTFKLYMAMGEHWRMEMHNKTFGWMFIIITFYSLSFLLMIMFIGYRKLKSSRAYEREQQMMLTIIRGSAAAAIWLVMFFALSQIFPEIPILPVDSLPTYAAIILAYTLRLAMRKHNFLATAEQRYKLLFTLSSSGVALMNSRGIVTESNPAFRAITGISESEGDIDILSILPDPDKSGYLNVINQAFQERAFPQQMQMEIMSRSGLRYMVEINSDFMEIEDELHSYLLVRDITEQQRNEQQLLELAFTDSLTGLANRYQFNMKLEEAVHNAHSNGTRIVVMQMDLDHFKWINDTMGHSAGDILLCNVADLIRQHTPPGSIVARTGGDEFALLAVLESWQGEETAVEMANTILHAFAKQVVLGEKYYHVSCSIGVCIALRDGEDPETLLRNADIAMYAAKRLGRNQYHLFTGQLKSEAERDLLMQQGLETALLRNEFSLVYQPQVDSRTGRVFGVEALLRWQSAELGFVSPQDFVPIAEQNGTIRPIGEWVMQEAAEQAVRWLEAGYPEMQMSVNVSASQLSDPYFARKVEKVLMQTGLPAHLLCLEFTESAAIREEEQIMQICEEIVGMGVTLAVDDFGTGYSSMKTVTSFPFQFIKIDRSLIFDIDVNPRNVAVVRSVIELAEQLKMNVLAEGVESRQHVDLLQQLGCYHIQGYYYGRPMKVNDLEAWMSTDPVSKSS
ncbi:putative bifunctional diguanylate cyclase/phosphodiesterase [Paenibacillus dauci]|uniref:putative bifunctional diguanylate cyclase/phosphodiesterase n=1 Tax=Paenibacillus dauci TaxID=1567106 RepID=UPI0009E62B9F|nr:EAL domain-containing protein [Paenibacillus dauci]